MADLKRCPFCGCGIVKIRNAGEIGPKGKLLIYSYAQCYQCGSRTGPCVNEDMAKLNWNRRAGNGQ